MRRSFFAFLAGACLQWAALPTFGQATEFLPSVGAQWRYSFSDRQFQTAERGFAVQVVEVQGSLVHDLLIPEGGDISRAAIDAASLSFVARPMADSTLVELAPYRTAFARGDSRRPTDYPGGLAVLWKIDPPSCVPERIAVPAGTFDAMRCEVKGSAPAFGQGTTGVGHVPTRFAHTVWYAREVKRYVRLRHQTWNRFGQPTGDELVQLFSYQPGR